MPLQTVSTTTAHYCAGCHESIEFAFGYCLQIKRPLYLNTQSCRATLVRIETFKAIVITTNNAFSDLLF